jgi:predicted nucleic acid-binding protein
MRSDSVKLTTSPHEPKPREADGGRGSPRGTRRGSNPRRSYVARVTHVEVVVDASAVLRGLTSGGEASEIFDRVLAGAIAGHAPDLVVAEIASALSVAVRAETRSLADAQGVLALVSESPILLHASGPLAPAALEIAAATQLSAYDALYAVLARALDVPLVTADRKLAAAVPGAILIA